MDSECSNMNVENGASRQAMMIGGSFRDVQALARPRLAAYARKLPSKSTISNCIGLLADKGTVSPHDPQSFTTIRTPGYALLPTATSLLFSRDYFLNIFVQAIST